LFICAKDLFVEAMAPPAPAPLNLMRATGDPRTVGGSEDAGSSMSDEFDSRDAVEKAAAMTNAGPPARGRRVKFTPQAIEKIKEFVAEGISRDEIANRLGVTVGSLQVTCSRLGISLRRIISPNGSRRHTADVRLGSVGIAHVREQKGVSQPEACGAPLGKFEIVMRCHGREQTADIPLSSAEIEVLALEAMSRDLAIAELLGQILVASINKGMIHKILRD
jgi:hypothetical protein